MNAVLSAPAKLNLCLYLGPQRADGLHELCSLFLPISLADRMSVSVAEADQVICPGIEGPDLTARALAALRAAGWRGPPLRIEVEKRIPVAAGLGGGSADAAAVLRLASGDLPAEELAAIAAGLGADVPSQIEPRFSLVGGAGERVEPLPEPDPFALVLVPDRAGLPTPAVFAEADRLGSPRSHAELGELRAALAAAFGAGADALARPELLINDLAPAATALRPEIEGALGSLRAAGAAFARLTGSGPTAFGAFATQAAAERAAELVRSGGREAIVAHSGAGAEGA